MSCGCAWALHYAEPKQRQDAEPIYLAGDEEIMPHLNELGRRFTQTIMQDLKTTLPLIYRQLQRIEAKLAQLPTLQGKIIMTEEK